MTENAVSFRRCRTEDAEAVWRLYRSLLHTPYCAWDDSYPARSHVDDDIAANALYCLEAAGKIVAAGVIRHCPEHDGIAPWQSSAPCDLMRIGVARDRQGGGLGALLLRKLVEVAKADGRDAMRILVSVSNLPALALYRRAGAVCRGEAFSYGIAWYCCELIF